MGWTVIVSEEDAFQREAIRRAAPETLIVGATGEASACGLVSQIDVDVILVDGEDEMGRHFLSLLRNLPATALPTVVAVGAQAPCFAFAPDIATAFTMLPPPTAA